MKKHVIYFLAGLAAILAANQAAAGNVIVLDASPISVDCSSPNVRCTNTVPPPNSFYVTGCGWCPSSGSSGVGGAGGGFSGCVCGGGGGGGSSYSGSLQSAIVEYVNASRAAIVFSGLAPSDCEKAKSALVASREVKRVTCVKQ